MEYCNIKNVVFDIGNVIVRWNPVEIIRLSFGEIERPEQLAKSIFQSELWAALNRGELSESEAKAKFHEEFSFSPEHIEQLFYYIKQTQILLFGSVELVKRVKLAGYNVYALTDNVIEIVDYLQSQYDFWPMFDGAIVSAEVGCLKPQPEIFHCLLNEYNIQASDSVFIDDMPHNVEGAKSLGFSVIQFEDSTQCEQELESLGLSF
ncbi:HAD family hydrolase [Photobacterium phosphoreum]|uniref:HAD family hydrolase n=1 Tax=Photobacterium phosphoreum TaxID=659 RepID=UPI000D185D95|nr:HAD family phosphatase [Photobacterium phosphoreum]MCD9479208.1 HAD-IA family hydrolase [Photobacterium phosphoreum]MCD9483209.1 HAD-IA family hydrolase [Photobacterium phosphoreum]PSU35247.1 HAD family hydrolase [Photobacterium phosphoreum]